MKSASKFWIFIFLTSLLFNCGSRKSPSDTLNMQKAYVLLRTEGLEAEINKLTSVLNSNFVTNKIASDINYYPLGRTWNNNEIFSTAYNNNYDYIILIDQVAKYTIDQRTNVGGKYQIRSYHIKSSNPDWVDLGQKTCNISVKQSVDKFSQQIISQIVPNYMPSKVTNIEINNDTNDQSKISEIDYNNLKSGKEIDNEIADLKAQLKKEKGKTNEAIAKKKRLEKEYENALSIKKKKNQNIIEGLEPYKKEIELEKKEEEENIIEAQILKEKKKEEKRLTKTKQQEAKTIPKKKKDKERIAEVKDEEEKKQKDLDKSYKDALIETQISISNPENVAKRKSKKSVNKKNQSSVNKSTTINKSNALIIIVGKESFFNSFEKLKDNLEFELLFANIKATTEILDLKEVVNKDDILSFNKSKYKYLVFIKQFDIDEVESLKFDMSIFSPNSNSNWKDLEQRSLNLEDKNSLKDFSKTILKSL